MFSMNPRDDCYFSTVIDSWGTTRPVCTYHADKDKDYWRKERPCESMDGVCPLYLSEDEAYNIIKEALKKKG